MDDHVKKIPFLMDVVKMDFDITKPQPQLFVTPDFSFLMQVLEEFSNSLSLRKGGSTGLLKLIDSNMVGTIELNTGLQVSGKFSRVITNEGNKVIFFKTEGPTALAFREKELIGHGITYHNQGFSSPLGKLKNINLAIEDMGPVDMKAYDFYDGKWLSFEFESGVKVEGLNITGIGNIQGKLMLIQLSDCTVTFEGEFLFLPAYGVFDMVVGNEIVSAYAGAADCNSFPNLYKASTTKTVKPIKSKATMQLEEHYRSVREMRINGLGDETLLANLFNVLKSNYPKEWLLHLEILEISKDLNLVNTIQLHLTNLTSQYPELNTLITDGLNIIQEQSL